MLCYYLSLLFKLVIMFPFLLYLHKSEMAKQVEQKKDATESG